MVIGHHDMTDEARAAIVCWMLESSAGTDNVLCPEYSQALDSICQRDAGHDGLHVGRLHVNRRPSEVRTWR